jgi:hypothetical protein
MQMRLALAWVLAPVVAIAATDVGIGVPCRIFPRREALAAIRLPKKVAAVVVCRGPGTLANGTPVTAETSFALDKRGGVYCSTVTSLEPSSGALIAVDTDGCGFYP